MADMMSDRLVKNQGMHINQLNQLNDQGFETDLSSRNQVGVVQALSPLQSNVFTVISQQPQHNKNLSLSGTSQGASQLFQNTIVSSKSLFHHNAKYSNHDINGTQRILQESAGPKFRASKKHILGQGTGNISVY
jgi:hypothetical protein